jgi:hypothetical protein
MFKCCLLFLSCIACGGTAPEDGCCLDAVKLGWENGFTMNMSYALQSDWGYSLIPKGAACEREWHGYQAMDNKGHGSQQLEVSCDGVSYKSIDIMTGGQYFVTKEANGTETCKVLQPAATRLPTLGSHAGGSSMCYGKAASQGLTRYVGPVLYGGTQFARYATPDQSAYPQYADVDVNNGCLPLMITQMGRVVTHFTNFKAGIPAHALDIPTACTKATESVMV